MKFSLLQSGRAVAALMVVVFHVHHYYLPAKLYPGAVISPVFDIGYSGVEFFFVLSGFLMATIHAKDANQPARAGRFLWKRFVRIMPFFWAVMAIRLFAGVVFPEFAVNDPGLILRSLFLIRTEEDFVITVAWTLSHEMLFYVVLFAALFDLRVGGGLFLLWMAGSVLNLVAFDAPYPGSFFFSAYNILFALGMISAFAFRSLTNIQAQAAAWAGVAGFVAIGLLDVYELWPFGKDWRTVAYGVFAAVAMAGLARTETKGRVRANPRWLEFLGDASYAIYLVHDPALSVIVAIIGKTGVQAFVPAPLMMLLIAVLATLAGVIAHLMLERPILTLLRKRPPGKTPAPKGAAGIAR